MIVQCYGCGLLLGNEPSTKFGTEKVSHGLCESCAHHFMAELGMDLDEYLEGIPVPVVTWGPDGVIGAANSYACRLLGKSLPDIQGYKAGQVFECKHALQPEGCGNTIHCSGCTIRKTSTDTMQTGKPHNRVPAFLNRRSDTEPHRIDLFISTEQKGGVIFLKIDTMEALPSVAAMENAE